MKARPRNGTNADVGDFGDDTRIEGEDGRFRANLSEDWRIWGPNGGYLAAIALRAAGASTPLPRPASFSCHFLGIAEFGPVDLEVVPLRTAKRAASMRVSMRQEDRLIIEAYVWAADRMSGLEHRDAEMPEMPLPDTLAPLTDITPPEVLQDRYPFWLNFEERRPGPWIPWEERRAGLPVWREWIRFLPRSTFPEDPFLDAGRSLLLIDTMGWPAACQAHEGDTGFMAPSIDVSVRFHDEAPEDPWLLCDARSPIAKTGLVGTDIRTWSTDGRLIASGGSQLLCRPTAPR